MDFSPKRLDPDLCTKIAPRCQTPTQAAPEEEKTIAVAAGDGLGDGAERGVDLALVLEAVSKDQDLHHRALVRAGPDRAWRRQPVIGLRPR